MALPSDNKPLKIDASKFLAANQRAIARLPQVRRAALKRALVLTVQEEHRQVPHKTGNLEASIYPGHISPAADYAEFGTRGCRYAASVHERLNRGDGEEIHFTKPGSKPKFVEDPAREIGATLPELLADEVQKKGMYQP